jgi:hypothetical protein
MRLILIRILGFMLPYLLLWVAIQLLERELLRPYRSVGSIEAAPMDGKLLPILGSAIRGLLAPPSSR